MTDDIGEDEVVARLATPNAAGDDMEIHKPKAVHNWRELLKEVGIIVIGVVIALSAEQAVEALHWMHQVDTGEAALTDAFLREADNAAQREAQSDCIAQRLAFLSRVVQRASENGRLSAIPPIGHPPFTPWKIGAWDALIASDTVSHLPRQKMMDYIKIVQTTTYLSELSDRENDQWTILDSIVGPGRRLSDVEAEQLRVTLAEAAEANRLMRRTSGSMRDAVKATGLVALPEFSSAAKRAALGKANAAICGPLTAPALTVGG